MEINGQRTALALAKNNMIMARKSKVQEIDEDDWREMSDESWDKMVSGFDEYLDACREELRTQQELQDEAARKAAAMAPADMRAIFAARASLKVAANGTAGAEVSAGIYEDATRV